MPTYDYVCSHCDSHFEKFSAISARKEPENQPCPRCGFKGSVKQITTAPNLVSGVNHSMKNDMGWGETMSKVAEAHPNSEVGSRYGKKSAKTIKTEQIMKKHGFGI